VVANVVAIRLTRLSQQNEWGRVGGLGGEHEVQEDERVGIPSERDHKGIERDPHQDERGLPDDEFGGAEEPREAFGQNPEAISAERAMMVRCWEIKHRRQDSAGSQETLQLRSGGIAARPSGYGYWRLCALVMTPPVPAVRRGACSLLRARRTAFRHTDGGGPLTAMLAVQLTAIGFGLRRRGWSYCETLAVACAARRGAAPKRRPSGASLGK
jgi:hypothetical protein